MATCADPATPAAYFSVCPIGGRPGRLPCRPTPARCHKVAPLFFYAP